MKVRYIKAQYVGTISRYDMYFEGFVGSESFKYLLFAALYLLAMYEAPPLRPFSMNKYMPISIIFSNFKPVIFNIAS